MDHGVQVITGPEHNVLARYTKAADKLDADYIVRITSDCPILPAPLISKHVFTALNHCLDYFSNVGKECNTFPDGFDVQVLSRKMLEWIDQQDIGPYHEEHVCSYLNDNKPVWAKIGNMINYCDESQLKLSVDTQEDYNFVLAYFEMVQRKISIAKNNGEVMVRF